jgi:phosphoserine phosphatase
MNRRIRLVVFDLDGTLTPVVSLWRYLHEAFGTWSKGAVAAQRYRRGEITYVEWAETDARYWAGMSLSQLEQVLDRIPYEKGVKNVFNTLRERSVKTAIVSAGLSILVDKVAKEVGADVAISNELGMNNGALTGEIKVKVALDQKGEVIEEIANELSIPMNEVALVGDRGDDLCIPECLRIAFKPKDQLARKADFVVEDDDLSRVLEYLL